MSRKMRFGLAMAIVLLAYAAMFGIAFGRVVDASAPSAAGRAGGTSHDPGLQTEARSFATIM